jgi:hypothetical protein
MTKRRWTSLLGAVAVLAVLAGCTAAPNLNPDPDAARPVTEEESQTLALVRFNNFDAGARRLTATLEDRGHELALDGWVDYTTHTGLAVLSVDGDPDRELAWNGAYVATHPTTAGGAPDVPADLAGWDATALDAQATSLQALLIVLASLGADRPENPLLLQQGGALWLRDDSVADRPVSVFAGPHDAAVIGDVIDPDASSVRYCVDADGLMLRVEVRLGASWATVDLGDAGGAGVPALFDDVVPAP